METADFYLVRGLDFEWVGSLKDKGSPTYTPYDVLVQEDELNYLFEVDDFLMHCGKDGVIEKEGWPHQYDDSRLTEYVYYFFTSMGRVLFSISEDQHKVLYDAFKVKKGEGLDKAKVMKMKRPFPKMKIMIKE